MKPKRFAKRIEPLRGRQARRKYAGKRWTLSHPVLMPVATFLGLLILTVCGYLFFMHDASPAVDTRVVVVSHDHVEQTVPSREPTVGALMQKLNIKLGEGDVVEPAPDTAINQDDFRINVYRAMPVKVADGDQSNFTFSAATTPRSIAKQTGITIYPEDDLTTEPVTNFMEDGAIGQQVIIKRATPLIMNLYGTDVPVRTQAKTVGDLLKEKDVKPDTSDSVEPSLDTPIQANLQVFIARKGTRFKTDTADIAMPVQTIDDPNLAYGTTAIRQQGSPGKKATTYQLVLKNDQVVGQTELRTVVVQQPVTQIVVRGTNLGGIKGDMALAGISPGDYSYADYIISHESNWNPAASNGSSGAYGLCQALPGSKMASSGSDWESNPITQLRWCNGYAVSRYGGWSNAAAHWQANGNW